MNKELLDKIVSIHEEIENVKNKIKLVNGDDIPYVLYDNNSHLICSDRTIISDAISFIKERYEANLADLQAELNRYEIVDSVPLAGVNPSDNPRLKWAKYVATHRNGGIYAHEALPTKKIIWWRPQPFTKLERITPEQAFVLCGRIPQWSDEEPTPVKR